MAPAMPNCKRNCDGLWIPASRNPLRASEQAIEVVFNMQLLEE
jgi:hypothetical protein